MGNWFSTKASCPCRRRDREAPEAKRALSEPAERVILQIRKAQKSPTVPKAEARCRFHCWGQHRTDPASFARDPFRPPAPPPPLSGPDGGRGRPRPWAGASARVGSGSTQMKRPSSPKVTRKSERTEAPTTPPRSMSIELFNSWSGTFSNAAHPANRNRRCE